MKPYWILFFCIATIFSLAACSGNTEQVQAERPAAEISMEQLGSDLAERVPAPESTESSDADIDLPVQAETVPAADVPEPKQSNETAVVLVQKPSATPVAAPEQTSNPSGETSPVMNLPEASLLETEAPSEIPESNEETDMQLSVQIGSSSFTATLETNVTADAFVDMMKNAPIVISMSDYSGFEKVGTLGTNLPTSNSQTTTQAGDIVLYNGNQIVIFYGSNTWSYTRLAKIDDLTGWESALGSGDVTVTFTLD